MCLQSQCNVRTKMTCTILPQYTRVLYRYPLYTDHSKVQRRSVPRRKNACIMT